MDKIKEMVALKNIVYNEEVATASTYFNLGSHIKVNLSLPIDQYINKTANLFAEIVEGPVTFKNKEVESVAYVAKACEVWKLIPKNCLKINNIEPKLLKIFSFVDLGDIKLVVTTYKNVSNINYLLDNPEKNRHKGVPGLELAILPDIVNSPWGAKGFPNAMHILVNSPYKQDLSEDIIQRIKSVRIFINDKKYSVGDLGFITDENGDKKDEIWVDLGGASLIRIENEDKNLYIYPLIEIYQIMTNQWLVPVSKDQVIKVANCKLDIQYPPIKLNHGDEINFVHIVSYNPIKDSDIKYVGELIPEFNFTKPFVDTLSL